MSLRKKDDWDESLEEASRNEKAKQETPISSQYTLKEYGVKVTLGFNEDHEIVIKEARFYND